MKHNVPADKLFFNLKNIRLYRDIELSGIDNANRTKRDRLRKDVITFFDNKGLKITFNKNITIISRHS